MKESDTYLTTVCKHPWSRQITMKVDKLLEFSANSVAFISEAEYDAHECHVDINFIDHGSQT